MKTSKLILIYYRGTRTNYNHRHEVEVSDCDRFTSLHPEKAQPVTTEWETESVCRHYFWLVSGYRFRCHWEERHCYPFDCYVIVNILTLWRLCQWRMFWCNWVQGETAQVHLACRRPSGSTALAFVQAATRNTRQRLNCFAMTRELCGSVFCWGLNDWGFWDFSWESEVGKGQRRRWVKIGWRWSVYLSSSKLLSDDTNLVRLKLCKFGERICPFLLRCKFIGEVFLLPPKVRNSSALDLWQILLLVVLIIGIRRNLSTKILLP
jgi:hypothetical protein